MDCDEAGAFKATVSGHLQWWQREAEPVPVESRVGHASLALSGYSRTGRGVLKAAGADISC